jgi:hypothetical protein
MILSPRQRTALVTLAMACVAGAIALLPAIYQIGLWWAPPRPTPSTADVPDVFAEAVWASIDGGRATEMRPVNPLNLIGLFGCSFVAEIGDPVEQIAQRQKCRTKLPALEAAGYLSRLHMRDQGVLPGQLRYAFAQTATGAWITRSWSKSELIETLAARSDFGFGWRGADAAALGYFGRPLADLRLPQASMLAALVGTVGSRELGMASSWVDPWCDPERVATMRRRVLDKMRDNLVIDDAGVQAANAAEFGLIQRPADHHPCPD